MKITGVTDYLHDDTGLPKSDVLKYCLDDGKTYFIIRPSGTEPKIKLYLGTSAESFEKGNAVIDGVLSDVQGKLGI